MGHILSRLLSQLLSQFGSVSLWRRLALSICVLGLGMVASSADAKPSQALDKVAYVDLNRALNGVDEGKTAKAELKAYFDKKAKAFDGRQTELKNEQEAFEKQKNMMKLEAKLARQEELQRQMLELQQEYVALQREFGERESRVTARIGGKLRKVIEKIGDRDGYKLIINIGDTVLFYKRHLEITDDIVREYNKTYASK